jgi:hypothetical protein
MAFNFNWSPLTADAGFYKRARDLLTTALNKSPKPPIIVDDIIVTEFNLGSVPPDLEILEIGDLAEDRFRGIFKMCYSGDAFLTLKTRVQVGRYSQAPTHPGIPNTDIGVFVLQRPHRTHAMFGPPCPFSATPEARSHREQRRLHAGRATTRGCCSLLWQQ